MGGGMTEESRPAGRASIVTWLGLFLALFGMLIVRQGVNHFWPSPTVVSAVIKELGMWIVALVLIVIIKVGEGLPLVIFGVGHWTGGWANILIALVLGAILAVFFIWRRDLAANMMGHWFVDFVGNLLPRAGG
jgi:hypothetical protein